MGNPNTLYLDNFLKMLMKGTHPKYCKSDYVLQGQLSAHAVNRNYRHLSIISLSCPQKLSINFIPGNTENTAEFGWVRHSSKLRHIVKQ